MTELGSRVERRKQQTRQRMVSAGRTLLETEGLDGLSIQGVTAEADVALGTFYNHFAGKEALIEEIVTEDDLRDLAAAKALTGTNCAPMRHLTALVAVTVSSGLVDSRWAAAVSNLSRHRHWPGVLLRSAIRDILSLDSESCETGERNDTADKLDLLAEVISEILSGSLRAISEQPSLATTDIIVRHAVYTSLLVAGVDRCACEAESEWALELPIDLR
ncbi:MAG: AcrR family transcriptional regulator [Candidatus Poriferisodalaceae bacterium]|jgi:AcrR family transcriptional regulator